MSVPFLVLLGGTRRHPKQWAYISCGTCVRNRINLSRGNYKEPYIKQPEYEPAGLAESRIAEKRERERKRGRAREGRGDQRDKRDGNGAFGKDRGGWKRVRGRRATSQVYFDSRGCLQQQRICRCSLLLGPGAQNTPRRIVFSPFTREFSSR